ncbi:MAG: hypothetical protein PVG85_00290 [Deltaproteobacteria bacterium]|jgi:hypothetical protein
MSIRLIAKELYALQQEVEKLEEQVRLAPPERQEGLKDRLRKLKAERERMRKVLDGAKEPPLSRQPT